MDPCSWKSVTGMSNQSLRRLCHGIPCRQCDEIFGLQWTQDVYILWHLFFSFRVSWYTHISSPVVILFRRLLSLLQSGMEKYGHFTTHVVSHNSVNCLGPSKHTFFKIQAARGQSVHTQLGQTNLLHKCLNFHVPLCWLAVFSARNVPTNQPKG